MDIIVRKIRREDLQGAIEVEKASIPGNHYFQNAYRYYEASAGETLVALIDEKVVGIARFTVLYDQSAWLECLRVHPDYQRKGVGTKLYERFMELAKEYEVTSMSLYTGRRNIGSYTLATNFGFYVNEEYSSYVCEKIESKEVVPFLLAKEMVRVSGKHLAINHTFFPNNEDTISGFKAMGYIYTYKDTTLIMGTRFQAENVLFIASIEGTYQKEALDYAINYASLRGINKIQYYTNGEVTHQDFNKNSYNVSFIPSQRVTGKKEMEK